MGLFEFLMLFCFGFSWPFSIMKSIRSKSTKGKSLMFMLLIIGGVLMIIMGFIGVYVGYIFQEVKHRPVYIVRSETQKDPDK